MTDCTDAYACVRLTAGELFFLASAVGVRELYITDLLRPPLAPEEIAAAIREGCRSLELRGLVSQRGGEEVIDRGLYEMLRPALLPEWVLRVETQRSDCAVYQFACFNGHRVLVECDRGQYSITAFRDPADLQRRLLAKAGVGAQRALPTRAPTPEEIRFVTRFLFTLFRTGLPQPPRSITLLGNEATLWLCAPNKPDQTVTCEQVQAMEFV